MADQKVLITGGAGFKGVVLAKRLLERGNHVMILDNFMYGYDSVLHLVSEPNLSILQHDIRNMDKKLVAGFDVIVHLAAIASMPGCAANPHSAQTINVQGTRLLVEALSKDQCLINASTTSLYGDSGTSAACDEDTPVPPPSALYGKTKLEGEKIAQTRENSISLRFATVFGVSPKMRVDVLPNDFTYKAVNDRAIVIFAGHSKRTFMHIDDAVNAYLFSIENFERMRGRIFNVGDEQLNFSKIDIANAINAQCKFAIFDSTLPDVDARNFTVSFKRIRDLGYKTERTLDDGIRDLLKLYRFYKVGPRTPVI